MAKRSQPPKEEKVEKGTKPRSEKLEKALSALNPRQRAFVTAYASRDSDSFANQTKSALSVSPTIRPSSAPITGHRLRYNVKVQTAVAALLEEAGFALPERITRLQSIADTETQVVTHKNAAGEVVQTTTAPVPMAARLKAIDIANKLDGSYAKAEAAVDIAKREYEQTIKSLSAKLFE